MSAENFLGAAQPSASAVAAAASGTGQRRRVPARSPVSADATSTSGDIVEFAARLLPRLPGAGEAAGLMRGIVDACAVTAFGGYFFRSPAVFVPATRCFAMNISVWLSIALLMSLVPQGSPLEVIVKWSWAIPIRFFTDVLGVYGYSLYPEIYKAAEADRDAARGRTPRKVRFKPSYIGEKSMRLAMQILATLIKVAVSWVPGILAAAAGAATWAISSGSTASSPSSAAEGLAVATAVTGVSAVWMIIELSVLLVCFLIDSTVYSFFCFECRLEQQGRIDPATGVTHPFRLSQLLDLFEHAWPYYLGYGLPQHTVQRWLEYAGYPLLASLVYATLMPINVVTALDARPGPRVATRLPLFATLCRPLAVMVRRVPKVADYAALVEDAAAAGPGGADGAEASVESVVAPPAAAAAVPRRS